MMGLAHDDEKVTSNKRKENKKRKLAWQNFNQVPQTDKVGITALSVFHYRLCPSHSVKLTREAPVYLTMNARHQTNPCGVADQQIRSLFIRRRQMKATERVHARMRRCQRSVRAGRR